MKKRPGKSHFKKPEILFVLPWKRAIWGLPANQNPFSSLDLLNLFKLVSIKLPMRNFLVN